MNTFCSPDAASDAGLCCSVFCDCRFPPWLIFDNFKLASERNTKSHVQFSYPILGTHINRWFNTSFSSFPSFQPHRFNRSRIHVFAPLHQLTNFQAAATCSSHNVQQSPVSAAPSFVSTGFCGCCCPLFLPLLVLLFLLLLSRLSESDPNSWGGIHQC
jgi:hypothetical protein